jgi:hypothetical protein
MLFISLANHKVVARQKTCPAVALTSRWVFLCNHRKSYAEILLDADTVDIFTRAGAKYAY